DEAEWCAARAGPGSLHRRGEQPRARLVSGVNARIEWPHIAVFARHNQFGRSEAHNRPAQPDRPCPGKYGKRDLLGDRVRRLIRYRRLFPVGAVVVQRIDHNAVLYSEPHIVHYGSELGRNWKTWIV